MPPTQAEISDFEFRISNFLPAQCCPQMTQITQIHIHEEHLRQSA